MSFGNGRSIQVAYCCQMSTIISTGKNIFSDADQFSCLKTTVLLPQMS